MNLKRTTLSLLVCGILATNAFADTLTASKVGNISVDNGNLASIFLTVNYETEVKNIGLIQFDLTPYSGSFSGGASLNLYHLYNNGQGGVFNLYQNTSAWDSSIASWDDRPTHLATAAAQLTIADSNQGMWRSVDVSAAVSSWTSGSLANYGFTLERVDQGNPYVYFASSGSQGPTLDLVTAPIPEPETYAMMLAGLGLLGIAARRRKAKTL